MTNTANKNAQSYNYDNIVRFVAANGMIIVHPNEHIIAKVIQKLQKSK